MRIALTFISLLFAVSLSAQSQRGIASFYAKKATGARTSSGEKLHHDSMTCAHRTHPFGTRLRVTCPATGKSVVVRVTDRGPFVRGRIIDLSWGAAKALGMLNLGITTVYIEVVKSQTKLGPVKDREPFGIPEIDMVVGESEFLFQPEIESKEAELNKETQHYGPLHHQQQTKDQYRRKQSSRQLKKDSEAENKTPKGEPLHPTVESTWKKNI